MKTLVEQAAAIGSASRPHSGTRTHSYSHGKGTHACGHSRGRLRSSVRKKHRLVHKRRGVATAGHVAPKTTKRKGHWRLHKHKHEHHEHRRKGELKRGRDHETKSKGLRGSPDKKRDQRESKGSRSERAEKGKYKPKRRDKRTKRSRKNELHSHRLRAASHRHKHRSARHRHTVGCRREKGPSARAKIKARLTARPSGTKRTATRSTARARVVVMKATSQVRRQLY